MTFPLAKSELSIFNPSGVQCCTKSALWVDYHPITSLKSNTPIEFIIESSENYLDLNDTVLYIKYKVTQNNGNPITEAMKVTQKNHLFSSLFKDINLYLNGFLVEGGQSLYGYKSYLTSLLQYNKDVKKTQFFASGWDSKNLENGKSYEVMGPLFLDMFTQTRYLLPKVSVRLRFDRNPSSFYLNYTKPATGNVKEPVINIEEAKLYVRNVEVNPTIALAHEDGLARNNAMYPLQKTMLKYLSVIKGTNIWGIDNILHGRIPKVLIMGLVKDEAFGGNYNMNPFEFKHFNLNRIGLYLNGKTIPSKELTPNFETGLCMREYISMFQNLEMFGKNITNSITFNEFKENPIFVFNLTSDLSMNIGQTARFGNLRLEMNFSKPLETNINIILYAIMDGQLEITKDRNIIF